MYTRLKTLMENMFSNLERRSVNEYNDNIHFDTDGRLDNSDR